MIGKILGKRYQLIEKIASGGMSNVYKALDLNLKRYDAVKILKDEYAKNADLVSKFKNEANAVANLNHPNIVNIYNIGQEEDFNYIVMEYVKGVTLKEFIREKGRLSEDMAISFSEQLALALSHAHLNNVIHRDVKPHNILVSEDGRIKILDFGIAKSSNSSTITNSGKIVGSVHYFSPEQARGNVTDRRSDIYSLGIVMYEMVTGRLPFDSESPVTIALKHMQEPIQKPKLINPQISEKLNQIILKATMKDPIDRYQTMDELLTDIYKLKENKNLSFAAAGNAVSNLANQERSSYSPASVASSNNSVRRYNSIEPDDFEDDFDLEEKREKSRNKVLLILLLVLLLALAGILAAASKYIIPYLNKPSVNQVQTGTVKVPPITGKTQSEATEILKQNGLRLNVSGQKDSDQPAGTVLEVSPIEGSAVNSGSTINVVLSARKEKVRIPDVSRKTEEEAKKILTDAGFAVGEINTASSDTIEKGYVIKTNPEQNTSVDKGSKINLVVSGGKAVSKTTMPAVTGKTLDEAKKLISDAKLTLGETVLKEVTDKTQEGKVIAQETKAGTELNQGSKVNITVGRLAISTTPTTSSTTSSTTSGTTSTTTAPTTTKPAGVNADGTVNVPNIKGMTYADAKAALESVGLNIDILNDYGTVPLEERIVVEYNDFPVLPGSKVQVNLTNP